LADRALERFARLFGLEFGHGKDFDLAPLRSALAKLGDPHARLPPLIHVAGTNGKGSTIAFMRAIAEAAGLRVHAFTKPHLFALNERFVVAGRHASDEALIAAAERIAEHAPTALSTDPSHPGPPSFRDARRAGPESRLPAGFRALGFAEPRSDGIASIESEFQLSALSQFDAQMATAFLLFSQTPADLALLETGMGGRDDSSNVIAAPSLCVLTPIGLDHQDALGETLGEIAAHKAGILKRGVPALIARQAPEAMAVIETQAACIGAALLRCGVEWDAYASNGRLVVQSETRVLDLPLPALAGGHQIDNAGLACAALMHWREIEDDAFASGLAHAHWPARLQALTRGALSAPIRARGGEIWVDCGHNVHAAEALARALTEMKAHRGGVNVAIIGLRARKHAEAFVQALARGADHIIAVPLREDHAAPGALAALASKAGVQASVAPTLATAVQTASDLPGVRVLICGSFLLAAEALRVEEVPT
jgi:dihydrofolate synthase / folylpolyglutamate synthase